MMGHKINDYVKPLIWFLINEYYLSLIKCLISQIKIIDYKILTPYYKYEKFRFKGSKRYQQSKSSLDLISLSKRYFYYIQSFLN